MFDNHSLYFSCAFAPSDAFDVSKFDAGVLQFLLWLLP